MTKTSTSTIQAAAAMIGTKLAACCGPGEFANSTPKTGVVTGIADTPWGVNLLVDWTEHDWCDETNEPTIKRYEGRTGFDGIMSESKGDKGIGVYLVE